MFRKMNAQHGNMRLPGRSIRRCFTAAALAAAILIAPFSMASAAKLGETFENKSTGPLYYSTYEYQQVNNTYFPESRMKSTIDWLASNYEQYGYRYFILDGWINTATRHTKNGYITTHSDSWTHDLSYWASYAHSKGLKFGFYYPPFWIHKDIVNDPNAVVEGTNIKVADVVDTTKSFQNWYLVDPDKAGAKQYMEGFINYMKQCGVDYMKIDFLGNYENQMGPEKLEETMQIISDTCKKDDIFCSWSAPNNDNHAAIESKYGDMLRISQDVFYGTWGPFSSNYRGQQFPAHRRSPTGWPEWANTFDAMISYSNLTGKGNIILDGDFVLASTMATDAEKESLVSLPILAGAGLGMTDLPENLTSDSSWVYKNREILMLNEEDLIAKPLSTTMDTAANPNVDSQIWVGQVRNGDWIVGLFNREDTAQTRSIDFSALGITRKAQVRDLWAHKELGNMTSFTTTVDPHGVTVIRISNPKG